MGSFTLHLSANGGERDDVFSAQRLAASWEASRGLRADEPPSEVRLLNASRHHGKLHAPWIIGHFPEHRCSTPRGIMGSFTRSRRARPSPSESAQRLAASWEASPLSPRPLFAGLYSAQRLAASWEASPAATWTAFIAAVALLNASRHHGKLHAHACAALFPCRTAQRLAASWEASQTSIGKRRGELERCSTPRGIMGSFTRSLRRRENRRRFAAQRLAASWEASRSLPPSWPPPPKSAQRLAASWEASLIDSEGEKRHVYKLLNASRHHGKLHDELEATVRTVIACSTPRGIMGSFTGMRRRWRTQPPTAQRLAASWEASPTLSDDLKNLDSICSTPRGIMGSFTTAHRATAPSILRCSTPRGIMGSFTHVGDELNLAPEKLLNASRHHGKLHCCPD